MADRTRRLIAAGLGLGALAAGGCCTGAMGIAGGWYHPTKVAKMPVSCAEGTAELPRGKRVRVLVWNIQFAASRKHRFFYDGGDAVSVPEADVTETLDGIAAVVRRLDPDIILWQEVDVDSRRTGRLDQAAELLSRVPYPCTTDAPYHKAAYVPHPPTEHLGKVDMRLAIWSKYRIESATRFDLPRLNESWIRQQFNLKRALLAADFPLVGGGRFRAFDTHLSAFSRADGTLPAQLATIATQLDEANSADVPWVLGADLNSLPPGDDPARLGDQAELYEATSPLEDWYTRYTPAVPLTEALADPQPFRTYLPFGSAEADRAIDHVFHGPGIQMHRYSVVRDAHQLSDHLPLVFDFAIP